MSRLPKLTAAMLHPQAEGRWLEIFRALCPGLFDEAIQRIGVHVTCPFHGGTEDFRFTKRGTKKGGSTAQTGVAMCTCGVYADGFAVLHRAMGGRFIDVLKAVDEYLNGRQNDMVELRQAYKPVVKTITPEEQAAKDAETLAKVKSLWANGKPLDLQTTPYYLERGIDPRILEHLQDVRVMASLGYYHNVNDVLTKLGSFPAILALMRGPDGDPVAVHRTWLTKERKDKAPVPKAKKLSMSPGAAGAAIRLFDAVGSDVLGLCEGIETGLAVRQLTTGRYFPELGPIPVWPCYAERNIRNFKVPESLLPTLRKIIVFADNDERGTGMAAALAFKERMAEEYSYLEVEIKMPDVVGWDWLDVLINL